MNLRHRYLVVGVRTLLGAVFLFSGIIGVLSGTTHSLTFYGVSQSLMNTTNQLWAMGIAQVADAAQIVIGGMLLLGFLPALATLMAIPITLGILMINFQTRPDSAGSGYLVALCVIYLLYVHWEQYQPLFVNDFLFFRDEKPTKEIA